jgi:hypothetical protein
MLEHKLGKFLVVVVKVGNSELQSLVLLVHLYLMIKEELLDNYTEELRLVLEPMITMR